MDLRWRPAPEWRREDIAAAGALALSRHSLCRRSVCPPGCVGISIRRTVLDRRLLPVQGNRLGSNEIKRALGERWPRDVLLLPCRLAPQVEHRTDPQITQRAKSEYGSDQRDRKHAEALERVRNRHQQRGGRKPQR